MTTAASLVAIEQHTVVVELPEAFDEPSVPDVLVPPGPSRGDT